ncbi:MAG: hypothetical protein LDL11_01860 [Desulfarculus sp.]|nr:hypothetical protein [Desulfarculus sp.]
MTGLPSERPVVIPTGDGLRLEGLFARPAGQAQGAALVLHPHPLYGGSMHNNVVQALRDGALAAGWAALRINFRGVGGSTGQHDQGRGEREDARAALEWLRREVPGPTALMGYSFGARVASLAAAALGDLAAGVLAAPALILGELGVWPEKAGPLLVVAGDRDQFTSLPGLRAYVAGLGARGSLKTLSGADHFLSGHESELATLTKQWLNQASQVEKM